MTEKKNWFSRLKEKWGVNAKQAVIILIVFALTGTTIMFLKKPVVEFFTGGEKSLTFSILYFILILPIYNVFLLIYGFLLGQFQFFWEYEKKFFNRMFRRKKK